MQRNTGVDIDIKITPSMRRKVDDLSRWLSAGDRSRMHQTTQTIMDLLIDTAKDSSATHPRFRKDNTD